MNFSLNEMEAIAKRATRGAGYPWGLAEEASKATRWLCLQGLDGARFLAQLLERGLAAAPATHSPQQGDSPWRGEGDLCPLLAGASLSDSAHLLMAGRIEMQTVAAPALLLPFVSNAARMLNSKLTVKIDGARAVTDGDNLMAPDNLPATAESVSVSQGGASFTPRKQHSRAYPAMRHWETLNRLARRTYAPETEESRRLGAGAGLSDND